MMSTRSAGVAVWILSLVFAVTGCGNGGGGAGPGGGGGTTSPSVVGNTAVPGSPTGVFVAGDYAFVASGGEGLQVVDVSDVNSPTVVAELPTIFGGGGMDQVSAGGRDFLYMAGGIQGVHFLDVTDPLAPTLFRTINSPGRATDLVLTTTNTVLCVADGPSGVQLYFNLNDNSSVDTPEMATGVAATDVYCFVTDTPDGIGTDTPALHVIDVSTPASPALVNTLPLSGSPSGIALAGNYVYVTAGDPGMYVIDISTPTAPVVAGQTGAFSATGPIVVDAVRMRAYVGTTDTAGFPAEGLKIINIANPSAPTIVATANLPDWTTGVDLSGDHAIAVTDDIGGPDPSSLQVVRISGF